MRNLVTERFSFSKTYTTMLLKATVKPSPGLEEGS